jgi:hypothetical protein
MRPSAATAWRLRDGLGEVLGPPTRAESVISITTRAAPPSMVNSPSPFFDRGTAPTIARVSVDSSQDPRPLSLTGRGERVRTDLDGLGDKLRQVGSRESGGIINDRSAISTRPALCLTRNVVVAQGESFDDYSGQRVVEMSVSVSVWHDCLLGRGRRECGSA